MTPRAIEERLPLTAGMRRSNLLSWVYERPEHEGLTASEIVDVSGIYGGHGAADRCFDDLKKLNRQGFLDRSSGRPARWNRRAKLTPPGETP